jgi:phosphatidylglycerophosphatase A
MAALPRLVASFGGVGRCPRAPGTAGSLAALVLGAGLLAWHPGSLWIAAVLATAGGLWAISAARIEGDPGWVVIDEVAGQWIALLPLPRPSWPGLLVAFALFRLLDISKPGPVGWADRQHGAFGIMADDVVAGAIAAVLIVAIQAATGALW